MIFGVLVLECWFLLRWREEDVGSGFLRRERVERERERRERIMISLGGAEREKEIERGTVFLRHI